MIGHLRGTLLHKDPPHLVVEVAGVGYELEAPASTWTRLPEIGADVQLRTHLVIREDQHLLFGFATEAERGLFRDLLKVTGVGARIALAILSGTSVEGFVRCVQTRDAAALTRVPGVGRKTAERLLLDLRDRVEEMAAAGLAAPAAPAGAVTGPEAEVMDALQALGYRPAEARRLVEQAQAGGALTTAEILRAALRAAVPGGRS
ncbi:MAG: Holliday junction branch migration protein RuvA [Gammaproteobacteria bacterium]|nr:Holliday junction branch migration protein RuvA [Gammaproteobacteria bacterium]